MAVTKRSWCRARESVTSQHRDIKKPTITSCICCISSSSLISSIHFLSPVASWFSAAPPSCAEPGQVASHTCLETSSRVLLTMRLPGGSADTAILSGLLFPMLAVAAGNLVCNQIVVDKTLTFNLEELGGPRSIVHRVDEGPSFTNTTYTIDICRPLGKAAHVKPENQCPHGTRRKLLCLVASRAPWSRAC